MKIEVELTDLPEAQGVPIPQMDLLKGALGYMLIMQIGTKQFGITSGELLQKLDLAMKTQDTPAAETNAA